MGVIARISSALQARRERLVTLARIEELEARLLETPQGEAVINHRFAPGIYMREMIVGAGQYIIGNEHRRTHANFLTKGKIRVFLGDGGVHELTAPAIVMSKAGTRKAAIVLEDVTWVTIHPTRETNIARLEKQLFKKSRALLAYEKRQALAAHQNPLLK